MKLMISAVCSAAVIYGSAADVLYADTDFVNLYNLSSSAVEIKDFSVMSEAYVPGFDINGNGVVDAEDISLIKSARAEKRAEEEKIKAEEAAEAERIAAEAQKAAEEQAAREQAEAETAASAVTEEAAEAAEEPEKVSLPGPKEMRGIDVSKWQGRIDWNKVREDGVEFVIIKAGEGTEVAKNFYANIEGAKEAGLACGVYWFSNAQSYDEAVSEANACLSVVSQYKLEFPVVCDFEYRSLEGNPLKWDRSGLTDAVMGFLGTVENGGFYSMLYTNKDFSGKYLEIDRITEKYDIWCAGYSVSQPGLPCGIWQYSESGVVNGIDIDSVPGTTKVDLDIAYRDFPEIMKALHINGF